MKNQLRDLDEQPIEYVTVERCIYDSMQYRLYHFEHIPQEDIYERLKNEEGILFVKKILNKEAIGFITLERYKIDLQRFADLVTKFENLPKFIKYLITKIYD